MDALKIKMKKSLTHSYNYFKECIIRIVYSCLKVIFLLLRFDYLMKLFFYKSNQILNSFFPQKSKIFKFIESYKQENKFRMYTNTTTSFYEAHLFFKKHLKFKKENIAIQRNILQIKKEKLFFFKELKTLETFKILEPLNFYLHDSNNITKSSFFFDISYFKPINYFFSKYLQLLKKNNSFIVIPASIIEIFNLYYLPLYELSKFNCELLHSIDREKIDSFFLNNFYTNTSLLHEKQLIQNSFLQINDDFKNNFFLINLTYNDLNLNTEKYLLNLQTFSYYIQLQKKNTYFFYTILYFNRNFFYLYHTLLFFNYQEVNKNSIPTSMYDQTVLLYVLSPVTQLFIKVKKQSKKKKIFKYCCFFFFHAVFFISWFHLPSIEVFFCFLLFLIFSFLTFYQYILFSYDINLQAENGKTKILRETFYLSTYFLTQQEDLQYFREAYNENLQKSNFQWFTNNYLLNPETSNMQSEELFFTNIFREGEASNFFEKRVHETLFHIFYEMTQINYYNSSATQTDNVLDSTLQYQEYPLVFMFYTKETIKYWLDPLFDYDFNLLKKKEFFIDNNNSDNDNDFNADFLFYEEELDFYIYSFFYNAKYNELFFDDNYLDDVYFEDLVDIYYKKENWNFKKIFGNTFSSDGLLKEMQKKLYLCLTREILIEKKKYLKKYSNIFSSNTIINPVKFFALIERGEIPYWVIDSFFFSQEVITRYKNFFILLLQQYKQFLNYAILFNEKINTLPITGTIFDYDYSTLYKNYMLEQTNFNDFMLLYQKNLQISQKELTSTVDTFSYNALALKQLLNSLNTNILTLFFSGMADKENSLKKNYIVFQHYLQYTTVYLDFFPRTLVEKVLVWRKILQHAAFNTIYDLDFFFYKKFFFQISRFFSSSKNTIFMLDLLQYYLKKYNFFFLEIPKSSKEIALLLQTFKEFEVRINYFIKERDLKKKLDFKESFVSGIVHKEGFLINLPALFVNNLVLPENMRTKLFFNVMSKELENAGMSPIFDEHEKATHLLIKYPPYYKSTMLSFSEHTQFNLQIPTLNQKRYLFPKYCHSHFLCEVDINFDLDGIFML
jgi:hypothetical protein